VTREQFFRQTEAALRALAVPFDARELLEFTEVMFPLRDQEHTLAGWAAAFLAEQQPAVRAGRQAAAA
jgi:hypothetical protein